MDNVREEIIGRVGYAPVMGRAKVYIIDEVHMLTPAAFNALLKTLEEPPENVVFVMCTTDPQKILATILSRVQRFDFHAIGNDEMQAHLAYVCSQEGFSYDEEALELVVRHARGGMRDALTSLEQLSVFGAGRIGLEAAQDLLGEASGAVLGKVARAMAHRDVAALFAEVAKLADDGRDLLRFTRELAAHLRDVYVVSAVPSADDVVAARGEELEALRVEAAAFGSTDRVARVLTILGDASSEMRTATNQRLVLEIALTRVARPESDLTLEALAERVADLERQVAVLSAPGGVVGPAEAPWPRAQTQAQIQTQTQTQDGFGSVAAHADAVAQSVPAAQTHVSQTGAVSAAAVAPAPEPKPSKRVEKPEGLGSNAPAATQAPAAPAAGGRTNGDLQRTWKQVVDQLVKQVPAKGSLLLSSSAVSDDGERLTVSLPKGSHFAAKMLERADVRASVDPVVAMAFGPRQVVYVESSLASQAISRAERTTGAGAVAGSPAPTPAEPPRAQAGDAPRAQRPAPSYPMPWDEPGPAPEPEPVSAPVLAPSPEPPAPAPAPTTPPATVEPAAPASAPAPTPEPTAPAAAPEPPAQELTPEFADIAAQLSAAFGQPLSVSVESAAATSDEEAAEELAYEEAPELDAGFTDEPVDDEDDEPDA